MHTPAASPFFDRAYDEAMVLLTEARNYLAYVPVSERSRWRISEHLTFMCETTRLTSQLTQVMAWLLAQRAVESGELTLEDVCGEEYRLDYADICLDIHALEDEDLPNGLKDLLGRGASLYRRVSRIEEQVINWLH